MEKFEFLIEIYWNSHSRSYLRFYLATTPLDFQTWYKYSK